MAGKQAKVLCDTHVKAALKAVKASRHPERNRAAPTPSFKAGGEIVIVTTLQDHGCPTAT